MRDDDNDPVDAEIVLRRAIELDSSTDGSSWQGTLDERLDHHALAEIAAQVGVSATAVASAIAEAQAGALEEASVLDRLIGPRRVAANRILDTGDEQATELLLEWLSVAHGLRPRVRPDGVIIAHRRRDLAGKMGTSLRKFRGLGGLSSATSVQAIAVGAAVDPDARQSDAVHPEPVETDNDSAVDPGAICVVADVGSKRNEAIAGGTAVAAGVSVVVTVAAVLTGPVAFVGIPVAAGLGTIVARTTHRTTVRRMTESVDDTVDGVVLGNKPPHPLSGLSIGKLVRRKKSAATD